MLWDHFIAAEVTAEITDEITDYVVHYFQRICTVLCLKDFEGELPVFFSFLFCFYCLF